jgi:hypothetical protein
LSSVILEPNHIQISVTANEFIKSASQNKNRRIMLPKREKKEKGKDTNQIKQKHLNETA